MDYCAKESTLDAGCMVSETPRVETSVKDQLNDISKNLYETDLTLRSIIDNLIHPDGRADTPSTREEKCLQDSLMAVYDLSDECMAMAHRIKDLLF